MLLAKKNLHTFEERNIMEHFQKKRRCKNKTNSKDKARVGAIEMTNERTIPIKRGKETEANMCAYNQVDTNEGLLLLF